MLLFFLLPFWSLPLLPAAALTHLQRAPLPPQVLLQLPMLPLQTPNCSKIHDYTASGVFYADITVITTTENVSAEASMVIAADGTKVVYTVNAFTDEISDGILEIPSDYTVTENDVIPAE